MKNEKPVFEKPIMILVIDDSQVFRDQIISTIKVLEVDFKVCEAENVAVAKQALEKYTFDVIFCDLNMPGEENGIDFVEYAVSEKKIEAPILMVTSESGVGIVLEAFEKGAKDYLVKPWKEEEFANKFYGAFGSFVRHKSDGNTQTRNIDNLEIQKKAIESDDLSNAKDRKLDKEFIDSKISSDSKDLILPEGTELLLLEDSEQYRATIIRSLKELKFKGKLFQAEKTSQAILHLKKNKISFAIIDWNLPDRPGIDLVKEMRKLEKFKSVAILMLTAENEVSKMLEAIDAGVDDYLVKPFITEDLKHKINLVWQKRKSK